MKCNHQKAYFKKASIMFWNETLYFKSDQSFGLMFGGVWALENQYFNSKMQHLQIENVTPTRETLLPTRK